MKYSELISFSPIESTIQLVQSNRDKHESANLVKRFSENPIQQKTHKNTELDIINLVSLVSLSK